MLKRSMVLVMVLVLVVSFSVVALADNDGKAPKNEAGVEILVEGAGEDSEIYFVDEAVNESAKDNPSDNDHPTNPILVAGS
jgi:hypothetical protein